MSHISQASKLARRAFLRRLGHLGIAGTAAPWALNLAAISDAAASTGGGYKALVCIFLNGGNDHGNTIIPYDSASYIEYAKARGTTLTTQGGVVIPRDPISSGGSLGLGLHNTALSAAGLPSGRQYALAPSMLQLKTLYEDGKLAPLMNVGPLAEPTTVGQYKKKIVRLPPKLFSHNDQSSVWQSSAAEGSVTGWGGQIGDLALSSNPNSIFTCVSVAGNAVFLSGDDALAYRIGTGGAVKISPATSNMYGSAACKEALRTLITQQRRDHLLKDELNKITDRAIYSEALLATSLKDADAFPEIPDTGLGNQLRMVARLVNAQASLSVNRQVFMVSIGGFDNHDKLATAHPALWGQIDGAMAGFQSAMTRIGKDDQVTTFTASEFGRTITSNGDGSDHGWGAHHLVMGGAVKGGMFYGKAPEAAAGGPEDLGQGRYIPTTSVDEYAATLARWMGVAEGDLALVVPNIGRFEHPNLGFLR